jgi:hypothetical protein
MSCCGGNRRAQTAFLKSHPIPLRLRSPGSIRATGSASGRVYEFTAEIPELPVDALDAAALLRSGRFEHAR